VHVNVSVAILINADYQVLLGQRPFPKSWEGWWEFPGGKIKKNETFVDALYREIYEEIGIKVTKFKKWVTRQYSYDNLDVTLQFFKVYKWDGEITPKENQKLVWTNLKNPNVSPILPANLFIQNAFDLPSYYAITNLSELPKKLFLKQLQEKIDNGLEMIQIREKDISFEELKKFSKEVIKICKPQGVKVIINSYINLAHELKADGVHLTSKDLNSIKKIPQNLIVSASCHTQKDIDIAEKIKIHFIVLSTVKKTLSHPDMKPMGWNKFRKIANKVNIPIYALGGLGIEDYQIALENGAIGIASQRSIWR
jgi:8-oxo-dGTP diphosphatase